MRLSYKKVLKNMTDSEPLDRLPPRRAVYETIRRQIADGRLVAGAILKPGRVLAAEFGYSLPTVHYALRELADAGYLIRRQGAPTRVGEPSQPVSRALLLYSDFSNNPFRGRWFSTMMELAAARNLRLTPLRIENLVYDRSAETAAAFRGYLAARWREGFRHIIREPHALDIETILVKILGEFNFKCLAFNDFWLNGSGHSVVRCDEEFGFYRLTEHLWELGHRRILLLDDMPDWPRNGAIGGFRLALAQHGVVFHEDDVAFFMRRACWRPMDSALLERIVKDYTAVICTYDINALQLLAHLRENGVQGISVAGFDGMSEGEGEGLTTMRQPVAQMIIAAFELLEQSPEHVEKRLFAPELLVRASTFPPPEERFSS